MKTRRCFICGAKESLTFCGACRAYVCPVHYADYFEYKKKPADYKHPRKTGSEIKALKDKYRNGVPAGEVELWING